MRRSPRKVSRHRGKRGHPLRFWWIALLVVLAGAGTWLAWESGRSRTPITPAVPPPRPSVPSATSTTAPPPKAVFIPSDQPQPPAVTATPPVTVASPPPVREPGPVLTGGFPRPPRDVAEAQVALVRRAISPGSIDGVLGSQTRAAVLAFQRREGLPATGALDADTRWALALTWPPFTTYRVTAEDLARLRPMSYTWLGKSQQDALEYETLLELVAEKGRASPTLMRRLNPGLDWTRIVPGTEVRIPDAVYPEPRAKAGFAVINLTEKRLQVFDGYTNLVAHFPCSIAARVEKRPAGELRVTAIAENPNYTFNPNVFSESWEARELGRKLILPPGPNNPVGTAWVSLDRPGYGIHGTPSPEQVGRTESHGCFRLANWNAEYFLKLVWVGMTVYIEP